MQLQYSYNTVQYNRVKYSTVQYSVHVHVVAQFYIIILFSCRVLSNHSREVYEMDGILDKQLQEAYVKQQMKVSHLLIVTLCIMSVNIQCISVYILMMTFKLVHNNLILTLKYTSTCTCSHHVLIKGMALHMIAFQLIHKDIYMHFNVKLNIRVLKWRYGVARVSTKQRTHFPNFTTYC